MTARDAVHQAQLSEQLCFALYSASKAVSGAYRPLLSEIGLSYTQYLVMLELWSKPMRTVSELGLALGLDSGTLSPLLKRIEGSGLIRRERSTEDERVVLVHLTARGRELERSAASVRHTVEAATGLSDAEFVDLRDRLQRVSAAVEAATRETARP